MKHKRFIIKCVFFFFILIFFIYNINLILLPKYTAKNGFPTTTTDLGFYEMQEDSIDVIFLGSSHTVTSLIPQEMYNKYGITSYNLGSEQQNIAVSYWWLREALRYQKPKVVILDCLFLQGMSGEPLNSEEAFIRKALDYMKWSPNKVEAIQTICQLDEKQSVLSYYLTNIRFHSRWKELEEIDFASRADLGNQDELKGYHILTGSYGKDDYTPIDETVDTSVGEIVSIMEEYLDKIRTLCEEKGIQLILIKTPYNINRNGMHNAISLYAEENNIPFYDFNENSLYNEIEYEFATDNAEISHANINGAIKITSYIGKVLKEKYYIESHYDEQWEKSKEAYNMILTNYYVSQPDDNIQ